MPPKKKRGTRKSHNAARNASKRAKNKRLVKLRGGAEEEFNVSPYVVTIPETFVMPKQIWSYWNTAEMPPDVKEHHDNNRMVLDDWKITLLSDATLSDYLDVLGFPAGYHDMKIQHRADYIRLALLKKYGGLWMDISIVVNSKEAFNAIYDRALESKSQATLFTYGGGATPGPHPDYIENWFIMAPAGSPVIGAWFHEFDSAVRMSFQNYQRYIGSKGFPLNFRIGLPYLTQHACLQVILQKHPELRQMITLYPAEDAMFKIHIECNWDVDCIRKSVTNKDWKTKVPYIKLRSDDRPR